MVLFGAVFKEKIGAKRLSNTVGAYIIVKGNVPVFILDAMFLKYGIKFNGGSRISQRSCINSK